MRSVVVFSGDSTFKTEMPENVTGPRGYIRYVRSQMTPVLTESEVRRAIHLIAEKRLVTGLKTHFEHVKHVKNIKAQKN
jgi:restriction system protein